MIDSIDRTAIGVLLAAGRGGRMGGRKQLIAWRTSSGDVPLIAAAYEAIQPICREIVVVLGAEADLVAAALGDRKFRRVDSSPDLPMFESIRAGLQAAQRIEPCEYVVLHPADHPQVSRETLIMLSTWTAQQPNAAIIPEYKGRGGHPVFIPAELASRLTTEDCPGGLGQFWREHPDLCVRVSVSDSTVVRDIDTPDDFER